MTSHTVYACSNRADCATRTGDSVSDSPFRLIDQACAWREPAEACGGARTGARRRASAAEVAAVRSKEAGEGVVSPLPILAALTDSGERTELRLLTFLVHRFSMPRQSPPLPPE